MWFRITRVKSDLVGKNLGLMRGKFVAALASISTDLLHGWGNNGKEDGRWRGERSVDACD